MTCTTSVVVADCKDSKTPPGHGALQLFPAFGIGKADGWMDRHRIGNDICLLEFARSNVSHSYDIREAQATCQRHLSVSMGWLKELTTIPFQVKRLKVCPDSKFRSVNKNVCRTCEGTSSQVLKQESFRFARNRPASFQIANNITTKLQCLHFVNTHRRKKSPSAPRL